MTEAEKLSMLENMTGETDQTMLSTYLALAKSVVIARAYPYGTGDEALPYPYHGLQVEIAVFMLNKRGAEGETSHSENGVSRTYETGDIPASLLRRITPMAGVM